MIILGIDPGTATTGYAILDTQSRPTILEAACIKTTPDFEMHLRLMGVHDGLLGITKKFKPEVMIVERLFFNTNAKTAMTVGQARGVVLLIAALRNMQVIEYTALQAKQTLTGYGRASKQEMQQAVKTYLKLEKTVKPDDANDAVAMVLCHLIKQGAKSNV